MTEPQFPRESIVVGTLCSYPRLDHRPWVLVTGLPGTIAEYTADGWEPDPVDAWDEYEDDTPLLRFAICDELPGDYESQLVGGTLTRTEEVARAVRANDSIAEYVGPRPAFNPLGPIDPEYRERKEVTAHVD